MQNEFANYWELGIEKYASGSEGQGSIYAWEVRGSAAANGAVTLDQVNATATLSPFRELIRHHKGTYMLKRQWHDGNPTSPSSAFEAKVGQLDVAVDWWYNKSDRGRPCLLWLVAAHRSLKLIAWVAVEKRKPPLHYDESDL